MKDDLLDNFNYDKTNTRSAVNRVLLTSVSTIAFLLLLEEAREYLPENILNWENVEIKTVGLIVVAVIILNSVLLPTYLNKISPKINRYAIAAYTGLIIFAIEIVFKAVQALILFGDGLALDYLLILKGAGLLGMVGALIANIRIHKLRGKKTLVPVLLILGIWLAAGLFLF